ncbi:MAG: DNA polymerase III subunit epsilon [Rickettsiales bacterium]|nr:DNA polymerase III subunit epsilon [Pseudomonadota bacterium]MDA0965813.1 DNA polymerase III subunit epsilon [Pseudomonadota bacterium]MDG4542717.1 DNA polymerase III subunit epsilon [Rickettsiales bacterium]MDG4545221.1 DNA polymerase III subunit epsilon [Rickettsiales bacterium]MDG4547344.1 DNA polymerase III subunit epsilon [Rickettsiales bacterium]
MREITFDTETTGIDPNSGHRIIEIGCVELIDKVRTGEVYHVYINPQRDIPKSSTDVHGLTMGFLSDKPVFSQVAKDFLDFIRDDRLVIHNAAFDLKFINSELGKLDLPLVEFERATDTLNMAREKFPGAKASLDALCNRFGIDLSKREKHGALLDAELLADVYIELIGGTQGAMQLDENEIKYEEKTVRRRKYLEKRSFEVSKEELDAHKQFLSGIKEPLWEV